VNGKLWIWVVERILFLLKSSYLLFLGVDTTFAVAMLKAVTARVVNKLNFRKALIVNLKD
jgi:hypothetical protein